MKTLAERVLEADPLADNSELDLELAREADRQSRLPQAISPPLPSSEAFRQAVRDFLKQV